MNFEELLYLLPYLFSLALSTGIFIYSWRHRYVRGAGTYALYTGAVTLTIFGFIIELVSPSLDTKILWDQFQWITQAAYVVIYLIFALEFSNIRLKHPRRTWGFLIAFPLAFTILALTDGYHHITYPNPHLSTGYPFPELQYDFSTIIYAYAGYVYLTTLYGVGLLLRRAFQYHGIYRRQYITIAVGFLIPVVLSVFILAGIRLTPQRDSTPFAFVLANSIVAWGLFRYKVFDLAPIAREQIVENMNDPVIVLDAQNRVVDINRSALTLIGKPEAEILGQSSTEAFAKWPFVVEMLDNPEEQRREVSAKSKGELYFFDINISLIRNKRDELLGRIVVARDITRHKYLEMNYRSLSEELEQRVQERTEELRASAERYRAVVENQTEFIVRWKPDRTRTFVNDAYCRYFGLTPEQALQVDFMTLIAEEDRPSVEEKIRRLVTGETDSVTDFHRVQRPDGSVGWQEWIDRPIRDESGSIVEFQSIGRDITERKQAEDEIRKLSRVVEQSNVSIIITDTTGKIEYVNPYFSEVTGYAFEEVVGQNPRILKSGLTDEKVYRQLWDTICHGREWRGEFCNRKKNGELYWESTIISPIVDSSNQATHFVAVKTDITERKQAEEIIFRQLAYDALMTKFLTQFATCSYLEVDSVITSALSELATFFSSDYVGLLLLSEDKRSWDTVYHWRSESIRWRQPSKQVPARMLSWSESKIRNGEPIRISSLNDYPSEAIFERQLGESEGVRSLLSVPIRGKELSVAGAIDITSYSRQIMWTETDVMHLTLIGDAIANLLERKRAELALKKSESKYRLLFEEANDSIFIMKDDRFIECNSRTLEMFGCRREEILGRSPVDFSPELQPDNIPSQQKARDKINGVLEGKPQFFEWKHCHLDKTPFDAEVSLSLLETDDGTFIQAIVRDITLRKQAEAALRKSEERFSKAFRASPTILVISRFNSATILEVNDTFEKISGYARHETIGQSTFDLNLWVNPDDREHILSAVLAAGELRNEEIQFRIKNGEILTCLLSAELIELGGESCILSTIQDISERKAAEARILRLNRLYVTISQINQSIVHARDKENLFRTICQVAIDPGQFRMAWIGLLDNSHIRPFVFAGEEQGYLTDLNIDSRDEIQGRGPPGTAIREGRCIICQDIGNDPRMIPWRDEALRRGYRSSAAVPIREQGCVIGALIVYASDVNGFDEEDESLLEQIGMDVSFALDSLDAAQKREIAEKNLAIAYDTTLEGWARALELRDKETEGHSRRVTETTLVVSRAMGFDEESLVHIRYGSLLHDIGKMGIPDEILRKNGPLTVEERAIVVKHPVTAYELLKTIPYLEKALEIPHSHHEKWNGTGYPQGLAGDAIPLAARIFAVVDVWDALSSDRPYRQGWSKEQVIQYLCDESGKHFDPKVVSLFLQLLDEGKI